MQRGGAIHQWVREERDRAKTGTGADALCAALQLHTILPILMGKINVDIVAAPQINQCMGNTAFSFLMYNYSNRVRLGLKNAGT